MAKLRGPARRYRHHPKRYEDVRDVRFGAVAAQATKVGCVDAVKGRKNPYKPEAAGGIAAYREGYRICEKIYHTGQPLTAHERHVRDRLHLESEIQFAPLGGLGRSRSRTRRRSKRRR